MVPSDELSEQRRNTCVASNRKWSQRFMVQEYSMGVDLYRNNQYVRWYSGRACGVEHADHSHGANSRNQGYCTICSVYRVRFRADARDRRSYRLVADRVAR